MKTILALLVLTTVFSIDAGQDPMRYSVRGDLERAKTYFGIVKHIDNKEFVAAETLFKTIVNTNGSGGLMHELTALRFRDRNYDLARESCNGDIDFWIIDTAADWQVPAFTTLLDVPDRLHFLQDLAAYRQKSPAPTPDGRKSEALVADILQRANERKR